MIDIITYVPDSVALILELQDKFPDMVSKPDENGEGGGKFLVTKTPTVRNDAGESMALVRGDAELLNVAEQLDSMIALGTYDDVLNDTELREIYDRVYDQTPITYIDSVTGDERTITKPEKFGVFA